MEKPKVTDINNQYGRGQKEMEYIVSNSKDNLDKVFYNLIDAYNHFRIYRASGYRSHVCGKNRMGKGILFDEKTSQEEIDFQLSTRP